MAPRPRCKAPDYEPADKLLDGIAGSGTLPAYPTTKGAIHTFTKTLSQLLLERGNVLGGTTTAG
jgi:hypothetical protein